MFWCFLRRLLHGAGSSSHQTCKTFRRYSGVHFSLNPQRSSTLSDQTFGFTGCYEKTRVFVPVGHQCRDGVLYFSPFIVPGGMSPHSCLNRQAYALHKKICLTVIVATYWNLFLFTKSWLQWSLLVWLRYLYILTCRDKAGYEKAWAVHETMYQNVQYTWCTGCQSRVHEFSNLWQFYPYM